MTSIGPVLCLSCSRLDRSTTDPLGTVMPNRCRAYPDLIPDEIALFGGDHHEPRGDEVDGVVYEQAPGDAANSDLKAWQAFTAA